MERERAQCNRAEVVYNGKGRGTERKGDQAMHRCKAVRVAGKGKEDERKAARESGQCTVVQVAGKGGRARCMMEREKERAIRLWLEFLATEKDTGGRGRAGPLLPITQLTTGTPPPTPPPH